MIKRVLSSEIVKGSFVLFILLNIFNFLGFLYQVLMARGLGPEDYGILAVLTSIFYFISIPSESIQAVVSKYTSKFKTKNEMGKVKWLMNKIIKKGFVVATCLFIGLIPFFYLFAYFVKIPFYLVLLLGLMTFSVFMAPVTRGVMQGLKKFDSLGLNLIIDALLKLLISVGLVFVGFKVYGAILGLILGSFIAFFLSFIPLSKIAKEKSHNADVSGIYSYASPAFFALIAIMAIQSLDVILAKRFFSPSLAGQYAAANLMGKIIFLGTAAIGKAMLPISSEKFETGKKTLNLLFKSLAIVLVTSLAGLLVYALFPELIVKLMFEDTYPEVSGILVNMGVAFIFIALANVCLTYLISVNKKVGMGYLITLFIVQIGLLTIFSESLWTYSLAMIGVSIFFFLSSFLVILRE